MVEQAIYSRRWWTLGVLCLSVLVIAFDTTILNVALPTLVRSLSATADQLQWIVDAYSLVFAGLLLTTGSLGDRYGRRFVLIIGLLAFAAGSSLAASAGSASQLIAIRAFMGLGGALIMPSTLATMVTIFPRKERAQAIAIWTTAIMLGIPLGPIMGGWILDHFSWQAVFLINLPVVALALVGVLAFVPESRSPAVVALDPLGALLSIAGLAALLYAIIEAPVHEWTGRTTLATLAAALILLGAFLFWELRCAHPMLPLHLFADRRFSIASLSITLVYFALMGGLFFLTQYLQFVLGYSPLDAGVRIVPLTLGLAMGAPLGAALVKRLQTRYVVAAGLAIAAGGLAILTTCTPTSGYGPVALTLVVLGFGMGLAAAPAGDLMMGAVPEERFGVGSAVNDTTQEVGGALGVAVLGSVLAASYSAKMGPAVGFLPAPLAAVARNSIGGALGVARHLPGASGQPLVTAAKLAFVQAMSAGVLVGVGIGLAGAIIALLLLPPRVAEPASTPASENAGGVGTTSNGGRPFPRQSDASLPHREQEPESDAAEPEIVPL